MSRTRFRKLLPLVSTLALMLPLFLALAAPVSAATRTVCASGCDYTAIQAAVNAAGAGDVIDVYPGTYPESVVLDNMNVPGALTLRTVNAGGGYEPHTATVDGGASGSALRTNGILPGDLTIEGFVVLSDASGGIDVEVNSGVAIRDVIANGTDSAGVRVDGASGNVTIEDSQANGNDNGGFAIYSVGGNLTVTRCTANDNDNAENFEIDGVGGNVTIRHATANRAGDDEGGIDVEDVGGNVEITDCTANDNPEVNIEIVAVDGDVTVKRCTANGSTDGEGMLIGEDEVEGSVYHRIGGNVTIEDCTANDNYSYGITVECVGGSCINGSSSRGADEEAEVEESLDDDDDRLENAGASVSPSANGGNVTISNTTTNENGGDDGIYVDSIAGDLEITNCTANENGESGFDPERVEGTVTIKACIARDNANGVDLDHLEDADTVLVNGNIICGNECGVGLYSYIAQLNLQGNWWGCDGGPAAAGCDPICQLDSIQVDFYYTPWIDTITASAPASAMAGEPTVVTFQFSGGPPAVYLGEGPGDLHGDPTFVVTTDNGTVTDPGFINAPNGVLEVTLVPAHGGTATVWVDGPCGLDAFVTLGTWEFVPEPGSVALLASGLVGLAGYAGLRMRRK